MVLANLYKLYIDYSSAKDRESRCFNGRCFLFLKELYRLGELLVRLGVLFDGEVLFVCFASLDERCGTLACATGMRVAACAHCRDEVHVAHYINEWFEERWIESARDDRAAFFDRAPRLSEEKSFVCFVEDAVRGGDVFFGRARHFADAGGSGVDA